MSKKIAAMAVAGAVALSGCTRIEQNEVGMRLGADGAIEQTIVGPKLICVVPLCAPGARSVVYKSFPDTFTISSGQGASATSDGAVQAAEQRQIFMRTADGKFVESVSISVTYEVNQAAKKENIAKIYSEFSANDESPEKNKLLIRDDLQVLAIQPITNAIRAVDALDIQDKGAQIGATISADLQAAVNKRLGIAADEVPPIVIKQVILGGAKFDEQTETVLRQRVLAGEQSEIAKAAAAAAAEQVKAAEAQAGVTRQVFIQLRGSVPESQLATAVCLDLVRQGRLPQTTNCFPGMVLK